MAEQKQNPLVTLVTRNQEKALALIEKHLAKDEKALYYAPAYIEPPSVLTMLPFIGSILNLIFKATRKSYLLVVTRKRLLMIGVSTLRFEETGQFRSIPVETIREITMTKYILLYNLKLTLSDGKKLLFQDLTFEKASGLKDAIESVQGRLSMPKSVEPLTQTLKEGQSTTGPRSDQATEKLTGERAVGLQEEAAALVEDASPIAGQQKETPALAKDVPPRKGAAPTHSVEPPKAKSKNMANIVLIVLIVGGLCMLTSTCCIIMLWANS